MSKRNILLEDPNEVEIDSLENLKSVIASVLKKTCDDEQVQCPIILTCPQPIESLKSFRNINHVKELNEKLAQLESENFKLKLKLFYLEEERSKAGHSLDSNQNIQLQVDLQAAKSDLAERNELLKETLIYLNNLDKNIEKGSPSSPSKSSETFLRDKTTSEDESLESQDNYTTTEDSLAICNNAYKITDKESFKIALNQLLNQADPVITPELFDHVKDLFATGVNKMATLGSEAEESDLLRKNIVTQGEKITKLEVELRKYQELDASIPTRDTPLSHEVELELRSLHQAVIEKDRLYQDAIQEKCSILKDSEERCKSIIAVAQERSEEVQKLAAEFKEMEFKYMNLKQQDEDNQATVLALQNEIANVKNVLEMELKEKNRILSEAEVLDQMQNEQSQELARLKNQITRLQELHQRTLDDLHDIQSNHDQIQKELKDSLIQLENARNLLDTQNKEDESENKLLKEEIERLNHLYSVEDKMKSRENNEEVQNERKSEGDLRCKDAELMELRRLYKEAANKITLLEQQLTFKSRNLNETKDLLEKYIPKGNDNSKAASFLALQHSGSYIEMKRSTNSAFSNVNNETGGKLRKNTEHDLMVKNLDLSSERVCELLGRDYAEFGQTDDLNELKEEICLLILKNQELEMQCRTSDSKKTFLPQQSVLWDASSIHNVSVLESSRNFPEQRSSMGDFLMNFEGTETNCLLLSHIYELEKFLQKLLTAENPSDLLNQESFTPVYVQSLKRALVNIDQTLDASQSGLSLMLMERTFKPLPTSMFNPGITGYDAEPDLESDGTNRDRDMSVMSFECQMKELIISDDIAVDKNSSSDDMLNNSIVARNKQTEKGEEMIRNNLLQDVVVRDYSSETCSSKTRPSSDIKNSDRVPRRRWSSSPFPQLPDPSSCFNNNSEVCSDSGTSPLSLFSEGEGFVSNIEILRTGRTCRLDTEEIISENIGHRSSRQRPLVLPVQNDQPDNPNGISTYTTRTFKQAQQSPNSSKCHTCGQICGLNKTEKMAHVLPPPYQRRSDWVEVQNQAPSDTNVNHPSCSVVLPYHYTFSSESDIWSEPDRNVSMERMGLDQRAIINKSIQLEGDFCARSIFFEPKKPVKRCSGGGKFQNMGVCCCNCTNIVGSHDCSGIIFERHCHHQTCTSTSSSTNSASLEGISRPVMCLCARTQLRMLRKKGSCHHKDCCVGLKTTLSCTCKNKELETLVSKIETTVESLFRELSKFQNNNPQLILQLLDAMKEGNNRLLPNLLEGQILAAFENLGEKMDSLGAKMNDVDSAARNLAVFFSLNDSSKINGTEAKLMKQVASPLNITTAETDNNTRGSNQEATRCNESVDVNKFEMTKGSSTVGVAEESLEIIRDCYNQLIESLHSSLDWVKSINDREINDVIEKQGFEGLLNFTFPVGSEYSSEVRRLNQMLPDWVRINRSLFQILAKNLREKKHIFKASEDQIGMLKQNLETKFKDLKQVQDWNLRLQGELDREKASLSSTLDRLSSVQDAFDAASQELKMKMDINVKVWEENKKLKSAVESTVSDSAAMKELCQTLKSEIKLQKNHKEKLEAEIQDGYITVERLKNIIETNRMQFESKLNEMCESRLKSIKEEIQVLSVLQKKTQQEKDNMFQELKTLRKEAAKHKEMENSWQSSYSALEKQLESHLSKLEKFKDAKDAETTTKQGHLENALREALQNKVSVENDCSLLGERLNEIQKKNRDYALQLKNAKDQLKKQVVDNQNFAILLKKTDEKLDNVTKARNDLDIRLQSETKARIEIEKLAVAEAKSRSSVERKLLAIQKSSDAVDLKKNPVDEPSMLERVKELELEIAHVKLNFEATEAALKESLLREKEKVERYKKNVAYAKLLLKQKAGISLKSSLTALNDDDSEQIPELQQGDLINGSGQSVSGSSLELCELEKKALQLLKEKTQEDNNQSTEDVIQHFVEQMSSLKADLEKTTKANETLTEKIKLYEAEYKSNKKDSTKGEATSENLLGLSEPIERAVSEINFNWGMNYSASNKPSVFRGSLSGAPIEREIQSSSESLLHSKVVGQLGNFRNVFNCISNEVPVRDIDNDTVLKNVASDFQSSNEEIQTIIAGAGRNIRKSPRSVYSSPDLGIESDPNRERGWSGSPSSDILYSNKQHFLSQNSLMFSNNQRNELVLNKHSSSTLFEKSSNLSSQNSNLMVIGCLNDLLLLKKEIEESSAILEGVKARIKDRILFLSQRTNHSSPAKSLEHSTLKEVDSSCYKLQVCLRRSTALISSFCIDQKKRDSPNIHPSKSDKIAPENALTLSNNQVTEEEKMELERLRVSFQDQSLKLKDALEALAGHQQRKENVDKAISRQLSKTKRVLRKAKGNLLEEKKADVIDGHPQSAKFNSKEGDDVALKKQVASTPMIKLSELKVTKP